MKLLENISKRIQDTLETKILQRRKKVLRGLSDTSWASAAELAARGVGSRASLEATLSELQAEGFVLSRFRGDEPGLRRGSVRVYQRSEMGQHWLTTGKKI